MEMVSKRSALLNPSSEQFKVLNNLDMLRSIQYTSFHHYKSKCLPRTTTSARKSCMRSSRSPTFTTPMPRCLSLSIFSAVHPSVCDSFPCLPIHSSPSRNSDRCTVGVVGSKWNLCRPPSFSCGTRPNVVWWRTAAGRIGLAITSRGSRPEAWSITSGGIVRRPDLKTHLLMAVAQTMLSFCASLRMKWVMVYNHLVSQVKTRVHIS